MYTAMATPDVALKQKASDNKRAQASATFEVLPRLMGFNENVILRAVQVDYARNILTFYFAGEGLEEIEQDSENWEGLNLTCYEGQESPEIIPPAWVSLIK